MGLRDRNGIWYLRKKINGKRYEISTGYPVSEKRAALKAVPRIIARLQDQVHGLAPAPPAAPTPGLTFGAWADEYEKTYSPMKSKPGRDKSIITVWRRFPAGKGIVWADVPLADFTEAMCLQALDHRRSLGTMNPMWQTQHEEVAEGTVQRERVLIQAMFAAAIKNGKLAGKNPWQDVPKEPGDVRTRLLLADDEAKLRNVLVRQWDRWLTFMLDTGLRLDECLKIDKDRKAKGSDITATYVHVHGKGKKRRARCAECGREGGKCRNVPLTARARTALTTQKAEIGKYWDQHASHSRDMLARACERAHIDHISPHDLRHTFGHRWLQKGGDIKTLSLILGHSSVQITERHYAHLLGSDLASKMLAVMEA